MVLGTLSMSATNATDIALRAEPGAFVTMDTMTLVGTAAPLVLPFACHSTIANSWMTNVQLQVDSFGDLTVTGSTLEGVIEGVVVAVSSGGVFIAASSMLAQDHFPCPPGPQNRIQNTQIPQNIKLRILPG